SIRGVEEMRLAFFSEKFQRRLDGLGIVGPVRNDLRLLVVADNQKFVAFINLISKLAGSLFQFLNFGPNSQGVIHQQNDAGWRRIGSEIQDGLFGAVVVNGELLNRNRRG